MESIQLNDDDRRLIEEYRARHHAGRDVRFARVFLGAVGLYVALLVANELANGSLIAAAGVAALGLLFISFGVWYTRRQIQLAKVIAALAEREGGPGAPPPDGTRAAPP